MFPETIPTGIGLPLLIPFGKLIADSIVINRLLYLFNHLNKKY
jgi:hypothetical protein